MATITPSSLNTIYVFQPAEDDAQQWLERIDRHGRLFCWTEEDKLDVAKCRLGPDAQAWDAASAAHVTTWGEYKKAFLQRFGLRPEDLYGKLATCRQSSNETVRQYGRVVVRFSRPPGRGPRDQQIAADTGVVTGNVTPAHACPDRTRAAARP